MEMAVNKCFFLVFLVIASASLHSQTNILKRKISLNVQDQKLEKVLLEISNKADFTFSYDASILDDKESVNLQVEEESVKNVLAEILPPNIQSKISGNHLILLRSNENPQKEKVQIEGRVYNGINRIALPNIVVYELNSLVSGLSDEQGRFKLSIPIKNNQLALSFSRNAFEDTTLFLLAEDQYIEVMLRPLKYDGPKQKIQRKPLQNLLTIETNPLVKQLVPHPMLERTALSGTYQQKFFQLSFLPNIGTNLEMSGLVENKISLNVLAGYSHAVGLFEMGGLFNVTQTKVKGAQIAGMGNMVGGNIHGLQMAGLFNQNHGSMYGFQIAGIHNKVLDTLKGVQLAGINNLLRGSMTGIQIAGVNNFTSQNVDGIQLAGISNITKGNLQNLQIAGMFNYCRNVEGLQLAGIGNFAFEDVQGHQLAGLFNKANKVSAYQIAGLINVSTDSVLGNQLSCIFNFAKYTEGGQLALFNFSDSTSGTPVGFLSFVNKGYREIEVFSREVMPLNIALKTGVHGFYNIFSTGLGSWEGGKRWMIGYGIGSKEVLSERWDINIEFSGNWLSEQKKIQGELSLLSIFDVVMEYKFVNGTSISLGPSLNLWISEWKDAESGEYLSRLAPYASLKQEIRGTLIQGWAGAKLGVHF